MANTTIPAPATARRGLFARGRGSGRQLSFVQQLLVQIFCLVVAASVLFPILWVVGLSLDGTNTSRPSSLRLMPPEPTFDAYVKVFKKPTSNPVTFTELAVNSLSLAGGVAFFSVLVGVTAAYAFSRMNFVGRKWIFMSIGFILLMPQIATMAPLFVMLSRGSLTNPTLRIVYFIFGGILLAGGGLYIASRIRDGATPGTIAMGAAILVIGALLINGGINVDVANTKGFNLRNSLYGVGFAMISGALPFAIWNLKGYLDTIPKELEEAAIIDGASPNQIFFQIVLPLATPALAVTAFLGFMSGWTEFGLSWLFLTDPKDFTLSMALWNMTGQYSSSVPWSHFAAMSLMVSLPVSIVYLFLQKYIVGGLTLGGVKG
ncbi:MAG TPA: ABC transporter permease subunit [Herpetosiphonaceae bacterium]